MTSEDKRDFNDYVDENEGYDFFEYIAEDGEYDEESDDEYDALAVLGVKSTYLFIDYFIVVNINIL